MFELWRSHHRAIKWRNLIARCQNSETQKDQKTGRAREMAQEQGIVPPMYRIVIVSILRRFKMIWVTSSQICSFSKQKEGQWHNEHQVQTRAFAWLGFAFLFLSIYAQIAQKPIIMILICLLYDIDVNFFRNTEAFDFLLFALVDLVQMEKLSHQKSLNVSTLMIWP